MENKVFDRKKSPIYYAFSELITSSLISEERRKFLIQEVERRFDFPLTPNGKKILNSRLIYYPNGEISILANANESNLEYYKREVLLNLLTDEEYQTIYENFRYIRDNKNEELKFQKATKIKIEDYDGKCFYYGDEYFYSEDELYDKIANDVLGEEDLTIDLLPEYVWGCYTQPVITRGLLDSVIERAIENNGWEDMDDSDLKGLEEIKNAFIEFEKANKDVVCYFPDEKLVLLIDREKLFKEIKDLE